MSEKEKAEIKATYEKIQTFQDDAAALSLLNAISTALLHMQIAREAEKKEVPIGDIS